MKKHVFVWLSMIIYTIFLAMDRYSMFTCRLSHIYSLISSNLTPSPPKLILHVPAYGPAFGICMISFVSERERERNWLDKVISVHNPLNIRNLCKNNTACSKKRSLHFFGTKKSNKAGIWGNCFNHDKSAELEVNGSAKLPLEVNLLAIPQTSKSSSLALFCLSFGEKKSSIRKMYGRIRRITRPNDCCGIKSRSSFRRLTISLKSIHYRCNLQTTYVMDVFLPGNKRRKRKL